MESEKISLIFNQFTLRNKKKKNRIELIYSSTPKDFLSNSALTNPSL